MDDDTAVRILEGRELEGWWFRKLLSQLEWVSPAIGSRAGTKTDRTLPWTQFSCPNKRCGAPIEEPSEATIAGHANSSIVACPACRTDICFLCRSVSHSGRGCNEEASTQAADLALYQMAQTFHWRRCPRCRMLVERIEGASLDACSSPAQHMD